MTYNIKYQTRLINFNNPIMEQEVKDAIAYNVNGKMESYRKQHLTHPDSEALIKTDIKKNANNVYEGKIEVFIHGQKPLIHESEYYTVVDFVNNSFKQFKEEFAQ